MFDATALERGLLIINGCRIKARLDEDHVARFRDGAKALVRGGVFLTYRIS